MVNRILLYRHEVELTCNSLRLQPDPSRVLCLACRLYPLAAAPFAATSCERRSRRRSLRELLGPLSWIVCSCRVRARRSAGSARLDDQLATLVRIPSLQCRPSLPDAALCRPRGATRICARGCRWEGTDRARSGPAGPRRAGSARGRPVRHRPPGSRPAHDRRRRRVPLADRIQPAVRPLCALALAVTGSPVLVIHGRSGSREPFRADQHSCAAATAATADRNHRRDGAAASVSASRAAAGREQGLAVHGRPCSKLARLFGLGLHAGLLALAL